MASIPESTLVRLFEMMVDRLGVLEDDRKNTHDTLAVIQRQLDEQKRFHFAAFLRANIYTATLKMFYRDSVSSKLIVSSPIDFFASKTLEKTQITLRFPNDDIIISDSMLQEIQKDINGFEIGYADFDYPLDRVVFTIQSFDDIGFKPTWDMDEYDFFLQLNLCIDSITQKIEKILGKRSVSVWVKKPEISGDEDDSDDEYNSSDDELDIDEGPVYDD